MYVEARRYLEELASVKLWLVERAKQNPYFYMARGNGVPSFLVKIGVYYGVLFFLGGCLFVLNLAHGNKPQLNSISIHGKEESPQVSLITHPATTATIPAPAPPPAPRPSSASSTASRPGIIAGNTYARGYCTWYAKNKRPDLPNNLGNANTWVSRARAQGIATGSTPKPGAVGARGNHLVYVERVNPDGTVFVSEMYYKGWNIASTRTTPAAHFHYIY